MAFEGLQVYGNIFNPLEPTTKVGPAPTEVNTAPVEDATTEATEAATSPMIQEQGEARVSPESARYFGPESRCGNCIHFMEPASCELVTGEIDMDGICMLFSPDTEEDVVEEAPLEVLPNG